MEEGGGGFELMARAWKRRKASEEGGRESGSSNSSNIRGGR